MIPPMRICLYTSTALPKLGGQEMVVDGLARALARRGHDVVVLAPAPRSVDRNGPAGGEGYRVVRHPRFVSTTWLVGAYGRFLRRITRQAGGFDVVHAHDAYPTGWIAVREAIAPVVITSHGGDLNAGNVRIVKPGVEARCRQALAGAKVLVSIGRFTESNYHRVLGDSATPKLVTIPNGVDLASLDTSGEMGCTSPEPAGALLYLGRLHPRKGVDVLIRAVGRVAGTRLLVVGDGPERESLERLAQREGGGRVAFLGRRVGAEKAALLRGALAVAMPSVTWEAFPIVVLEAAAAGKAVLAGRVAGLEDLVEDGVTGRLIPPGDVDAWAASIQAVLSDPGLAGRWGQTARERVAAYDWDVVAGRYEAVYRAASGRT